MDGFLLRRVRWTAALGALTLPLSASAWELAGTKTISLHEQGGQAIPIGTVTFRPEGRRTAFVISLDHARFKDFFLSMKEFKCLQGPNEVLCHVPYPYQNPGTVRPGDTAWLEHQLLFLFKQPRDFGAKLWNGLYFRLQPDADGLGLVGLPQAVDLNLISAPPDDLLTPPYNASLRDDVAAGSHWIERLLIR